MKILWMLSFLCLMSCSRETGALHPQPASIVAPESKRLAIAEPENVEPLSECHAADVFSRRLNG